MAKLMGLDKIMEPDKQKMVTQKIKNYYKIDWSTQGARNLIKVGKL